MSSQFGENSPQTSGTAYIPVSDHQQLAAKCLGYQRACLLSSWSTVLSSLRIFHFYFFQNDLKLNEQTWLLFDITAVKILAFVISVDQVSDPLFEEHCRQGCEMSLNFALNFLVFLEALVS
ncbi:hypothetical protein AVEN_75558-1 [Araneus ventricosus]|uniref:Uncharacterized protein n=1 Tax=Araneus ventricosus TaxID=182803 RepID=A0A4Y2SR82_ARAVE|nr:hypothetical protein AVEN_75558-1 [Araneus ventricosus]